MTPQNEYILTGRNDDLSKFYTRLKSNFEKEFNDPNLTSYSYRYEGWKDESEIISMINSGVKFYTHNPLDPKSEPAKKSKQIKVK
jgi:hypothetical protein